MAASYPSSVVAFSTKVNLVDTIVADHINRVQEEVVSVQNTLGTTLLDSSYSGTFAQTASWANLGLRLRNIEAGLVNGVAGSIYARRDSGNAFTPPSGSVGIQITSASGNSSDLLLTKDSSNANKFRVDSAGLPKVGTAAILYEGSTEVTNLTNSIINTATAAASAGINPLMLIG